MNTFLPSGSFVGFSVPDAVRTSRCATLLAEISARGFSATALLYPDDYRNNDRLVFDDPALAQELFAVLKAPLPDELVVDGSEWRLVGLNSRFRACRYQDGQGFCVHRDGPYVPSEALRSMLTVQLYLDDVPTRAGGHTRFYADARGTTKWASIPPIAGTAIIFDHRAWHDGGPVSAGIKHVVRTDAMYRRVASPKAPLDDEREVVGRHPGYAWKAIPRQNGELVSAGRDGAVRTWRRADEAGTKSLDPNVIQLGLGSLTALHEVGEDLWVGTRSGALLFLEEEHRTVHAVAKSSGAVLAIARAGSDDAITVVASTASGVLMAFDEHGTPKWTSDAHQSWAWGATPYRDGVVSVGHDGRVCFTRAGGATHVHAELGCPLRSVATDGDTLWVGDARGGLHILSPGKPTRLLEAHEAAITSLAVTADGVVTGSEDGCVKRWRDGVVAKCVQCDDFVTSVALTASDEVVCAGYDGVIWMLR